MYCLATLQDAIPPEKSMKNMAVLTYSLFEVLQQDGFEVRMSYNKERITGIIHHEIGEPLTESQRGRLNGHLSEWLCEHFPGLLAGHVHEYLSESNSVPVRGQPKTLAIRERIDMLIFAVNVKRAREREEEDLAYTRARQIGSIILQQRDVYDKTISTRDIQEIGELLFDDGLSYRQSRKVMSVYKKVGVANDNGHMQTRGRDLNLSKLSKFV